MLQLFFQSDCIKYRAIVPGTQTIVSDTRPIVPDTRTIVPGTRIIDPGTNPEFIGCIDLVPLD
jgi:hypothetical protein